MKRGKAMKRSIFISILIFVLSIVAIRSFLLFNSSWSLDDWGWARLPAILYPFDYKRGDMAEFTPPVESPFTSAKIIVGVAGDKVEVDSKRRVTVNEIIIGRAKFKTRHGRPLTIIEGGTIPPNHFFMAGTHADSYDSRYAEIGFIHKDRIKARLWALPAIPFLGLDGPLITKERWIALEAEQ